MKTKTPRAFFNMGLLLGLSLLFASVGMMLTKDDAQAARPEVVVPTEPYCIDIEGIGKTFTMGGASKQDLPTFRTSVRNGLEALKLHLPPDHPKKNWRPTRIAFVNLGDEVLGIEGEMVCVCGTYDSTKEVCDGQCATCEHCWVPSDHSGWVPGKSGSPRGSGPKSKPIIQDGSGPLDGPTPPPTEPAIKNR